MSIHAVVLRVAGCALFLLWVAYCPVLAVTLLWAMVATLLLGLDEKRTSRIVLNPAAAWVHQTPVALFTAARRAQGG